MKSFSDDIYASMIEQFHTEGYFIADFYNDQQMRHVENLIRTRLDDLSKTLGIPSCDPDWTLANYHESLGKDNENHKQLLEARNRYFTLDETLLEPLDNEPLVSIFEEYWGGKNPVITHWQKGPNGKFVSDNACGFRVIRPNTSDVAGVHVDVYNYGDSEAEAAKALDMIVSRGALDLDMFTAWLPITAYDDRYTLRFAPRSHVKPHPREAFDYNPAYITRPFKPEYVETFEFIRPNLKRGQAIIFHPNLLHGGSSNLGDVTRVSIEIRLRNPNLTAA